MNTQNFLNLKGIKGEIYEFERNQNRIFIKEDGSFNILDPNGFYYVELQSISYIDKTASISVSAYLSKRYFINQYSNDRNKRGKPKGLLFFMVDNRDEVLDEAGSVITQGTFDRFFSKLEVRKKDVCENDKALELVKSFDGTNIFQETFPINFFGMTLDTITQNNINNAIG